MLGIPTGHVSLQCITIYSKPTAVESPTIYIYIYHYHNYHSLFIFILNKPIIWDEQWHQSIGGQGWRLLSRFPPLCYFPNFLTSPKYMLAIQYHVHIWQVSPQLSCGDTCQIWMGFKECNRHFCEIENFAYGEIDKRSFSNPLTPARLALELSAGVLKPSREDCVTVYQNLELCCRMSPHIVAAHTTKWEAQQSAMLLQTICIPAYAAINL